MGRVTRRLHGKAALDQLYGGVVHEGRPLLFLDFDNVICLGEPYDGYDVFAEEKPNDLWQRIWHPPALQTLLAALDEHDPQVVLTTSWLRLMDRAGFEELFIKTGLERLLRSLHDAWSAPQAGAETRHQAVERWLAARYQREPLIILDDDISGTGLRGSRLDVAGCVLLCEPKVGLHAGHMEAIRNALKPARAGSSEGAL